MKGMVDPSQIRRIAINTGGGDAPGLNAVIRAVTLSALGRGWEVFGIKHGYRGLLEPDGLVNLTRETVRGITHQGGSILGTASKDSPFEFPVTTPDGVEPRDISDQIVDAYHRERIDALIVVGGDGSFRMAQRFVEKGLSIIGVPKTIDNDIAGTELTFGFETAVATATDAIDKLHTTAEAHERVMVVEVMGRYAGWIALHAGLSGGADIILLPEIPFDVESVCEKVRERDLSGRPFAIAVVAEGAYVKDGSVLTKGPRELGREVRLGGIGQWVAAEVTRRTGKETRSLVLGHLQRGGSPCSLDRLLGLRFGTAAVRALAEGQTNVMVALAPPAVKLVPLADAINRMKSIPLDSDSIATARSLGVCLGD